MPLFFFISGYLYRDKELSFKMLLEKNSKKLLFPYIFFGICGYVLWLLEMKPNLLNDALKPLKALFWMNTENMPIAGALWFLTAMFFLNLAYPFLFKCGILVQGVIVSFCLIVGLFLYQVFGVRLPFALDVAFVGLFFFHVGNRYKKYERGTLAGRQQKLNRHMHDLFKLIDDLNAVAIVTNQVMANPGVLRVNGYQ